MTITPESLTEIIRAHLDGRGLTLNKSGYVLDGKDEDDALRDLAELVFAADDSAPRQQSYAHITSRTKTAPMSTDELLAACARAKEA
jgi:hypothetical protein